MKVQHICSIKTRLEELTSSHLVKIDSTYYTFEFDRYDVIKSIYTSESYFFSACIDLDRFLKGFKEGKTNILDMYDRFIEDKHQDSVYLSLLKLQEQKQAIKDRLDKVLENMASTLKENNY